MKQCPGDLDKRWNFIWCRLRAYAFFKFTDVLNLEICPYFNCSDLNWDKKLFSSFWCGKVFMYIRIFPVIVFPRWFNHSFLNLTILCWKISPSSSRLSSSFHGPTLSIICFWCKPGIGLYHWPRFLHNLPINWSGNVQDRHLPKKILHMMKADRLKNSSAL